MIVNGKLVQYDLSRFSKCKLKRAAICDLMQIPDFVQALNSEQEFDISDAWIAAHALELKATYRTPQIMKTNLDSDQIQRRIRYQIIARNVVSYYKKNGYYEQ